MIAFTDDYMREQFGFSEGCRVELIGRGYKVLGEVQMMERGVCTAWVCPPNRQVWIYALRSPTNYILDLDDARIVRPGETFTATVSP